MIGCKSKSFPMTYLGLPLSDKRLCRTDYLPVIHKIQKALAGWKAPLLSVGGRLTLTNAVLSAIPQFLMSVFLLPKWVLRKIDQIRRRFLWHGHKDQEGRLKGIYMVNWAMVTRPKKMGGLGVRDLDIANRALLVKWMWNWIRQPHTWWKHATPMADPSDKPWHDTHATPFWKTMKDITPAFHASIRYQIGSRETVSFWHDNWTGTPLKLAFPTLYHMIQNKDASVAQNFRTGQWALQHSPLSTVANLQKQQLLIALQDVHLTQAQNAVTWLRDTSDFSVRSIYRFLSHTPAPNSHISNIWSIKAHLRVSIFGWLLIHNRLATIDNLVRKGWYLPNICALCRRDEETVAHLFQHCLIAKEIRSYIFTAFVDRFAISPSFKASHSNQLLTNANETLSTRQWELVTCFVIWRERCRRVFSEKQLQIVPLVREIKTEYTDWFHPSLNNTPHTLDD